MPAEAASLWWGLRDRLCFCLCVKGHFLYKAYLPSHLGLGVVRYLGRFVKGPDQKKKKTQNSLGKSRGLPRPPTLSGDS